MATAPLEIRRPDTTPTVVPTPPLGKVPSKKWLKWGSVAVLAAALCTGFALWRARLSNAIVYETVPVERGAIQAKVTATGSLNAVVDVLVSSQVSGNIKALYSTGTARSKRASWWPSSILKSFQAQVDQVTATLRSMHAAALSAQAQLEKAKAA